MENGRGSARFKKIMLIVLLLAVMVLSVLVSSRVSDPVNPFNAKIIQSLDKKQEIAENITAAATGASLLISMLPGDTGTPIANELGDIASKLLIVLGAILLEKYLLTIFEYASFSFLFPAACLLFIGYLTCCRHRLKETGMKLVVFGCMLCITIPASEHISGLIQKTYEVSINETIENANSTVERYQGSVENGQDADGLEEAEEYEEEEKGTGFWSGIGVTLNDAKDAAADTVTATVDYAAKFRNILDGFIESVALMIVLCCGIPVVTLLFMLFATKQIFSLAIRMDSMVKAVEEKAQRPAKRIQQRRSRQPNQIEKK